MISKRKMCTVCWEKRIAHKFREVIYIDHKREACEACANWLESETRRIQEEETR
jgi:hypothetical protein